MGGIIRLLFVQARFECQFVDRFYYYLARWRCGLGQMICGAGREVRLGDAYLLNETRHTADKCLTTVAIGYEWGDGGFYLHAKLPRALTDTASGTDSPRDAKPLVSDAADTCSRDAPSCASPCG